MEHNVEFLLLLLTYAELTQLWVDEKVNPGWQCGQGYSGGTGHYTQGNSLDWMLSQSYRSRVGQQCEAWMRNERVQRQQLSGVQLQPSR